MASRAPYYQTLTLDDVKYEVYFWFWPGTKGSRGKYGEPLEPDDPPEIEITEIYNLDDKNTVVENLVNNEALKDKVEEELWSLRK